MITNSTRITVNTYSTLRFISFTPILVLKRGSRIKWHGYLERGANVTGECVFN